MDLAVVGEPSAGVAVRVDEESLSDHAYIDMTVVGPTRGEFLGRAVTSRQRRWMLKDLDTDELLEAVRTSS